MNVQAIIIHLNRATERRKQVDRLLEQVPGTANVLEAVDGATLDDATTNSVYQRSLYRPRYPFRLRIGEIACFLSHRKCWQTIVDHDLDAALIVEDDVQIDDAKFQPAYELAIQNCTPDDFIRFPTKNREQKAILRHSNSTHELFTPKVTGLGMQAQLVGRRAALTLLEKTETFDRPVDTLLQMPWQTGVWPLCVWPTGISEIDNQLGGSRIGEPKSWNERIHREVFRPLYRLQLASRAARDIPTSKVSLGT